VGVDRAIARSRGRAAVSATSSGHGASRTADATAAVELRVMNPPDGAMYWVDPTLRSAFQTIGLRATSAGEHAHRMARRRRAGRHERSRRGADWPLAVGRHVVTASDSRGHRADAAIVVK
jgi:hypothetical protein